MQNNAHLSFFLSLPLCVSAPLWLTMVILDFFP
jgi:hypothetical protein